MKEIVIAIVLLALISEANAQYPKLVIQFTDKNTTPHMITSPSAYLSSRAIARRTRYNIPIDSFDLPIVPRYIDSVLSKGAVTLLSRSKWLNQVLIHCTDAVAINKIMALPFVKDVRGIGYKPAPTQVKFSEKPSAFFPSSPLAKNLADNFNYGSSYNQVHIHEGEFLHNKGFSGQGIVIGVLDAGFNSYKTIPFFDSVRLNGQILGERDFVAFDNSVNEDDSHGMFCLSTMASNYPGKMVGTAPKANYWLIRTENSSSEYPIEEHNWVVGAEFSDSCGADMISSSVGYNTFDDPSFNHNYNEFYNNATTVTKGATVAAKKGMIVMCSAGNEGTGSWKYIVFPADADSICAVGAVTQLGVPVGFSSYGYPGKVKPNIASVGAGTILAGFGNEVVSGSGTSYANPNIAGLIACLWQAFPEFNNMQILDAVYRSCPTYNSPDDRIGFGIPNMRVAYDILEQKRGASFTNSWLIANPVPFSNSNPLSVKLKAPETGKISIQLVDAKGSLVDRTDLEVSQNNIYDIEFRNLYYIAKGVYFIRYIGKEKQTLRVIKL